MNICEVVKADSVAAVEDSTVDPVDPVKAQ